MGTKVLMVCLGNICRSPLAEGILKANWIRNPSRWILRVRRIDSACKLIVQDIIHK